MPGTRSSGTKAICTEEAVLPPVSIESLSEWMFSCLVSGLVLFCNKFIKHLHLYDVPVIATYCDRHVFFLLVTEKGRVIYVYTN